MIKLRMHEFEVVSRRLLDHRRPNSAGHGVISPARDLVEDEDVDGGRGEGNEIGIDHRTPNGGEQRKQGNQRDNEDDEGHT